MIHPVHYISLSALWVFEYHAVAYNADVLGCNVANIYRISTFLGALERPGPLLYNARDVEIR